MPGFALGLSAQLWFLANAMPREAAVTAQVVDSLLSMRETWIEFQVSGFGLALPWLLQAFGG